MGLEITAGNGGGTPLFVLSGELDLLELTKLADRFIVVGSIEDIAAAFDAAPEGRDLAHAEGSEAWAKPSPATWPRHAPQ